MKPETTKWQKIASYPRNGKPFFATGYNYGDRDRGRHYRRVVWKNNRFMDAEESGSEMKYLTHWIPDLPRVPR